MKINKNIFYFFWLWLTIFSCGGEKNIHSFIDNEKNGLHKIKILGDYKFSVKYIPYSVYTGKVEEKSKETLFFRFRFSSPDETQPFLSHISEDMREYIWNMLYYEGYAKYDFFIATQQGDTLLSNIYHFERNYNLAPFNDVLLSFNLPGYENNQDFYFIYDDEILGVGPVKFYFESKNIEKLHQKFDL